MTNPRLFLYEDGGYSARALLRANDTAVSVDFWSASDAMDRHINNWVDEILTAARSFKLPIFLKHTIPGNPSQTIFYPAKTNG